MWSVVFIDFLFFFSFEAPTLKPKFILNIGNETQLNIKLFKDNIQRWEKVKSLRVKRLNSAKKQVYEIQVHIAYLKYFKLMMAIIVHVIENIRLTMQVKILLKQP